MRIGQSAGVPLPELPIALRSTQEKETLEAPSPPPTAVSGNRHTGRLPSFTDSAPLIRNEPRPASSPVLASPQEEPYARCNYPIACRPGLPRFHPSPQLSGTKRTQQVLHYQQKSKNATPLPIGRPPASSP